MAQSGYTPIYIYSSGTSTNQPTAGSLGYGELALNYADGKLYYKNASNVITLLASSTYATSVTTFSAGTTGFTPSTATNGVVTLAGTLASTNGGTGLTTFVSANNALYSTSSSALTVGTLPVLAGGTGVTTSTGSGSIVLNTTPTLITPILGTPNSGTLTNCIGLPISTGVSGLGTGIATALAVNTGTAGSIVVNGGVLGTPSSGTLTNATGLPLTTGVTGTLPVANGGTGTTTAPTAGSIVYGASASAQGYTVAGTTGQALLSGGTGSPTWGTLGIASGGTGQTSATAAFNALSPITTTGDLIIGNGTNSATRLAIGTNAFVLTSNGTTASWQAIPTSFAAGANTQVQYNSSGSFAGSANMTFNGTTLTLANNAKINGIEVGTNNGTGFFNVLLGDNALASNSSGTGNVAVGHYALYLSASVYSQTGIGTGAGIYSTGSNNTMVGYYAMAGVNGSTNGTSNTAIGYESSYSITSGYYNVAVGSQSGFFISTGSNNVCLGYNSGSDALVTITTSSNNVVLGNNSTTSLYCKTSTITTSDIRDKTGIRPITLGLDFVNKVNTIAYQFKVSREDDTPSSRTYLGWSAQDVMANQGVEKIVDQTDPEHLKMAGMDMVAVLWNAVRELSAQVESLQAKIAV